MGYRELNILPGINLAQIVLYNCSFSGENFYEHNILLRSQPFKIQYTISSIPTLSLILTPSSNVNDGILSHKGADSHSPDFMLTSELNNK